MLRITHARLRAEWLMAVIALALMVLYTWYCGADIRSATSMYSYEQFEFTYHSMDPIRVAEIYELDVASLPARADLMDVYNAVLLAYRGFIYARILNSAGFFTFLALGGMAAVMVSMVFHKKRIGQFLSAGYSRLQVFLSITLAYFAFAVLLWGVASFCQLTRYHISFAPEEQGFFRTTQLAWLCNILCNAALAYLFAMLLQRPVIAFAAALGVRFVLLFSLDSYYSPLVLIKTKEAMQSLEPGLDLHPLILGNWITLGFLAAVLIVSWLSFRKRGVAA